MDLAITHVIRIAILIVAIPLIWLSRKSIKSTARMLIILDVAFIIRSVDDIGHLYGLHILSDTATAILSSVVAVVFFLDVWSIFLKRNVYTAWIGYLKSREDDLEMKRAAHGGATWDQPHYNIDG